MRIEHIGIAVKDLNESNKVFEKLLGKGFYKEESVASEGVKTSFYQVGESKIELVGSEKNDSAIEKYLEKNREGIHHLAFRVDNLDEEIERLKNEGFIFINETPKLGADNKRIVFLHPKSTNGVLVELCEDVK